MPIIRRPVGASILYASQSILENSKTIEKYISLPDPKSEDSENYIYHKFISGSDYGHWETKTNSLNGKKGQIFTPGEFFPNLPSSKNNNKNDNGISLTSPSTFEPSSLLYNQFFIKDTGSSLNISNDLKTGSFISKINGKESNKYYALQGGALASINTRAIPDFPSNSPSIIQQDTNTPLYTKTYDNNPNAVVYSKKDLSSITDLQTYTSNFKIQDFRTILRKRITTPSTDPVMPVNSAWNIVSNSPAYAGPDAKNIELRVNLGDPGYIPGKNLANYVTGAGKGAASIKGVGSYDKINVLPIYEDSSPDETNGNDLVKFRIGVINNSTPSKKRYIHFRAFLDTITDTYNSDWQDLRYIGRGEKFYTYTGFDRTFSLSWTVAAQSKAELIPMYKKLNYLASICAPDYNGNGYMRGNIITLTVGGYLYEQPGIIKGITYTMNEENQSWEIGIPSDSTEKPFYDSTVKELPHIIKVSGFQFIPIHTFVPRLQNNSYNASPELDDKNVYGQERYIHLSTATPESWNSTNNNYGEIYKP